MYIIESLIKKNGEPILDKDGNEVVLCNGSYIEYLYGNWDKHLDKCKHKKTIIKDK